jgi:SAM-dependent methyltransferase
MNWEQTIKYIRADVNYANLVEKAYFEEDLVLNVERYRNSSEYKEILRYINKFSPKGKSLLDLGSGNGISAIAFALDGYYVKCIEPDPSETVGSGAIKKLKDYYSLNNIEIYETFAENIKFYDASFDIVFARQCMHHAHNLNKFVSESARVLRPGGMFFTVRDHIIFNLEDKEWFLSSHPLHRFYGGENAFKEEEYLRAIIQSGLTVKKVLKHFDSIINYYPMSIEEKKAYDDIYAKALTDKVVELYGAFSTFDIIFKILSKKIKKYYPDLISENKIPGRMYSFIALKPK